MPVFPHRLHCPSRSAKLTFGTFHDSSHASNLRLRMQRTAARQVLCNRERIEPNQRPCQNSGEEVVEYRRRHRMNTASQNKMLRSGNVRSENEVAKLSVDMIRDEARMRSRSVNSGNDRIMITTQASNSNTPKAWKKAGERVRQLSGHLIPETAKGIASPCPDRWEGPGSSLAERIA